MTDTNFYLRDDLLATYRNKTPDWGYRDAYGTAVGEVVFLRTYSRMKDDGTKETWFDVCKRVIEGMFTLQKRHCIQNRLPWDEAKAQIMAEDAFVRMFEFKWTPPGRGLWTMGTPLVMEQNNSAALQNCAFVSTKVVDSDFSKPFLFLMEASMLGIGVGFDTEMAKGEVFIHEPDPRRWIHVIPDTREGWVESVGMVLDAFFLGVSLPNFDYSLIRPAGEPIKTFGGTAAGPQPLIDLHNGLIEILSNKIGQVIDSRTVADIGNLIGVCVVSGNVRRSAELLLGEVEDEDFLALKDYEKNPDRMAHGWMSNNSVRAERGTDLSGIVEGIVRNGEPGVVWMDTSREYGRLADPVNNKDWRAVGYNPSLVAGTKVYTTDGVLPIEALDNKEFKVRNLNGEISDAYCWKSGIDKDVYDVNLVGGHTLTATEEHKWPTWDGERWVKKGTLELEPGDKLPNLRLGSMYPEGERGTYDQGFLIGWNLGDGWITRRPQGIQVGFMVSDADRASGIDKKIESSLSALGSTACFDGKDEINVNNKALRTLFSDFGVRHKSDGLPDSVWDASFSDEYRKGIIDGLFSADGTVEKSRISLSQASEKMIRDVAALLSFFGVKTSVSSLSLAAKDAFPAKYDDPSKMFTRWTLRIGECNNTRLFHSIFTLSHKAKEEKIAAMPMGNHKATNWFVEVASVESAGKADVWDVTVQDETHAFQVAHCVTGNCAEQTLESYECCTLTECFMDRHDNLEDFLETLKVAYLYAKTVTLIPTHWPETNAVMQRNRRIGASVSGVTNFADKHGLPTLRSWLDAGYQAVQDRDKKYSEWLGVRESIKTTSVKPSGTVSLLAGSSPGAHWPVGGRHHIRRVTFSAEDPMVQPFRDAGYVVEDSIYSKNTVVVEFPVESRAIRSEKDVSAWEKATMAGELQRYWADNSVSVTVSFDPEEEAQHIAPILHWAAGNMKTISFLPMGNQVYGQMPYENLGIIDWARRLEQEVFPVDLSAAYGGEAKDAEGESFCTTDACEIRSLT